MELVELTPLSGALVGLPGVDGLSTEQRKRLTIAVELVANPSIVFMDEPTSGLDARAAAIVMRTVRNIVNTGRTIVCTIHQPSIDIFESFDEVVLLFLIFHKYLLHSFFCKLVFSEILNASNQNFFSPIASQSTKVYTYLLSLYIFLLKLLSSSSWCAFPVSQRYAHDRIITVLNNNLFLYCYDLFIHPPLISSVNAAFVSEARRRAHICWSTWPQV